MKSKKRTDIPSPMDLTEKPTQSTPDCYARVVRFIRRDTRDFDGKRPVAKSAESNHGIRHLGSVASGAAEKVDIIDIASDIMSCAVSKSKSSPTGAFHMMLAPGNVNYHHVLNPGDYIFIWMKRNRVQNISGQTGRLSKEVVSNDINSGLKMFGVIESVRRTYQTKPGGKKTLRYEVQGKDFGYFFESDVYYNKVLYEQFRSSNIFNATLLSLRSTGNAESNATSGYYTPSELVTSFLNVWFGSGESNRHIGVVRYSNQEDRVLKIPPEVVSVFGETGRFFKDILNIRSGIEKYGGNFVPPNNIPSTSGYKQFKIDPGSNHKLWSILSAYSNSAINEMFTDLKLDRNGKLMPTFILRQIPFTTQNGAKVAQKRNLSTTLFTDLPRVKIGENFILEESTGRAGHERFNFIQLYGFFGQDGLMSTAAQVYFGNYAADHGSINRWHMRTMIAQTDFLPYIKGQDKQDVNVGPYDLLPGWTEMMTDWWLGAHTLETGSIRTIGIEEPISVGDNLEIDRKDGVNELYHIESYQHIYTVAPSGQKAFRTNINLSRGQRIDELPVYASGQLAPEDILGVGITGTSTEATPEVSGRKSDIQGLDPKETLGGSRKDRIGYVPIGKRRK